jgi:hypothetical protein
VVKQLFRTISAVLLFSFANLLAQTGGGSILGTVHDTSGAVIPAAKIVAGHLETGRQFETTSNEVGFFLFPTAPIGNYKVTIESPGMQAWQGNLLLRVGQAAALEPVLNVSSASTQVTVAGDVTPIVETTNGTMKVTIEDKRIEQMPINGRGLANLYMVAIPGMENSSSFPVLYGMRFAALETVVDGSAVTNRDTGTSNGNAIGMDAVKEFTAETNGSSAKMNRPGTVVVSTKSGTNMVHGAAFDTHRNSGIGVARRREDFYLKPPHLVRNEFGGSLGGPVYLPKVYNGKNRTFFFFAYEGNETRSQKTTSVSMPTLAMRQGDFSALVDSAGRQPTLYNPYTTDAKWSRQPFPKNVIPANMISPLAKHLYSITPLPTTNDNPSLASNFFGPSKNNTSAKSWSVRLDQKITDSDQVFVRFSRRNNLSSYVPGAPPTTLDETANLTNINTQDRHGVVTWTRRFSPTFFSETVASVSNENYSITTGANPSEYYADKLGLPNPFGATGWPYFRSTGFTMIYDQKDNARENRTVIFNIDQNLTKVHGRHEFQFGGRFRNDRTHVIPDQQFTAGNTAFSATPTALYDPSTGSSYGAVSRTGNAAASLFLGLADSYAVNVYAGWYRFRDREYAAYFQDNFKASSRLTLNFGVRWEFRPPFAEQNNLLTGFDLKSMAIVNGNDLDTMYRLRVTTPSIVNNFTKLGVKFITPEQAGLPDRLIKSNHLDFGPRAGFAYRLSSGKRTTVLRGGYGLYTYLFPLRNLDTNIRTNPPYSSSFQRSYTNAAQSPDGLPNYILRSVPTVVAGQNSNNVIDLASPTAVNPGGFTVNYVSPDFPAAKVHQWNMTVEREVMANTLARIGYIGNHGFNLEQTWSYNSQPNNYVWFVNTGLPLPTGTNVNTARRVYSTSPYGGIQEMKKTGWNNYNGVQLELQRRYSKGYGFHLFYVIGNAFRSGGTAAGTFDVVTPNVFLNGAVPTDPNEFNTFYNYTRDTGISKHRLRWNWLVDLPVGKGKPLARSAPGWLDHVIGGWQIAGQGFVKSNYWTLPTSDWGYLGDVEIYGRKYPIEDCRSGSCIPGYLFYNGYIPTNKINSYDANGKPNGVMGVPSDYKPSHLPIHPTPANGGSTSDPNFSNYETNSVNVKLKDGSTVRTSMDTNLHPWRNLYRLGPSTFNMDASLFKFVQLKENVRLRLNVDFFNVLNTPGTAQPDAVTGIVSLRDSVQDGRQLQLTLRLIW